MTINDLSSLSVISVLLLTLRYVQANPPLDGDTSRPQEGQQSLVIVFDTTGSMTSELEQVKREAKNIIEYASDLPTNPFYNFIFVDVNDPDVRPAYVTTNRNEMLAHLQKISIFNGDNWECPEPMMEGMRRALEEALFNSQVFVFTDADAKDYNLETAVTNLVQDKQAKITFFITPGCYPMPIDGSPIYARLKKISSGMLYILSESDIGTVMIFVKKSLNIERNQVSKDDFEKEKLAKHTVVENTKQLTITVTGANSTVKFKNPDNKPIVIEPQVSLNNLKIYQIDNPQPGPWEIDVKVDSTGSLEMTEVSPLKFKFGFAMSPPQTISETFVRPLKGTENYLVVALLQAPAGFTFTHVTITEGNTTNRYNLHPHLSNLVITDKFLQNGLFQVNIHGTDRNKNELQRLISTYIRPAEESPPSIRIIEKKLTAFEYGEVFLKCAARSFSKLNLKLMKAGVVLKEIVANQSFVLDHTIPIASLADNGVYVCQASNRMGKIEKTISVSVTPRAKPMPKVTVQPEAKEVPEHGEIRIQCKIKYPYDSTYWTFVRNPSRGKAAGNLETRLDSKLVDASGTLILPSVTQDDAGNYTCTATAKNFEVKDSVYIAVTYKPKILDSVEESIEKSSGSLVELTCFTKGYPVPEIEWLFVNLNSGARTKLDYSTDRVTINNLNFTHDGSYECTASNGIGEPAKRMIKLKVKALEKPELVDPTENPIIAKIGDTKTIECKCDRCLPMRSHFWTFNNVRIDETRVSNMRLDYSISDTDHFETKLTINAAGKENEGTYKCMLENDQNSASQEIVLNLLRRPEIKQISVSNSRIGRDGETIIQENKNSVMDCQLAVELRPTFEWFKDGVHVSSDRQLRLDAAKYTNSGLYQCKVTNSEGADQKSIQVQVHGHPKIISVIPENMVKLNAVELKVECKATGYPIPKVRWENENGKSVSTAEGILKLPQYTNSFSTTFTCYAENSSGSTNRTTTIKYQLNVKKAVGEKFQLLCRIYINGVVDWYKDNEKIKNSPEFYIMGNFLTPSKPNDYNYTGLYRCETNRKQFYFQVTTMVQPGIAAIKATVNGVEMGLENDEITVQVGQEVFVRCLTKGGPAQKVYWRTQRRHLEGGESFHLASVKMKDDGRYNCFAKFQGIDKLKRPFYLRVLSPR